MSHPVDRTATALRVIADFLRKLPADEVDLLIDGQHRLVLVPPGARIAVPGNRKSPSSASIDVDLVRRELTAMTNRDMAADYVENLGTIPQLQGLASQLGVPTPSKPKKRPLAELIVDGTVGSRLINQSIRHRT